MKVMNLLTQNRHKLEQLASELLLKEMLQYSQIEEILGKRPEGLFPVHIEEESLLENEDGNQEKSTVQSNSEQLTDKEQAELEEAVARLKQGRIIQEN